MAAPFEKVFGLGDKELDTVQSNVEEAFDSSFQQFSSFGNLAAGTLIQDVEFQVDVEQQVPHPLGRPWSGVLVVASSAYTTFATNREASDTASVLRITMGNPGGGASTIVASLWVF